MRLFLHRITSSQRYNISLWEAAFRGEHGIKQTEKGRVTMLNNTKDILTLKELQELLHIGKNTALRLVQSGDIEAFKVGKQWRITRDSILKFILRC